MQIYCIFTVSQGKLASTDVTKGGDKDLAVSDSLWRRKAVNTATTGVT